MIQNGTAPDEFSYRQIGQRLSPCTQGTPENVCISRVWPLQQGIVPMQCLIAMNAGCPHLLYLQQAIFELLVGVAPVALCLVGRTLGFCLLLVRTQRPPG